MRLTELEIKNFRSFELRSFRFHPNFNLIIGENASGKTTVLEAAAVAVGSWLLGFNGPTSRSIRESDVRYVLDKVESRARRLPQYPVEIAASGKVESIDVPVTEHFRWRRALKRPKGRTTQTDTENLKSAARRYEQALIVGERPTLPVIRYFSAGRLWEPEKRAAGGRSNYTDYRDVVDKYLDSLRSPLFGYESCMDPGNSSKKLVWWMVEERRIELDEGRESSHLQAVYGAILSMMPELGSVAINLSLKDLVLHYADGRSVAFSDLSDGYRNVVAMVADLAIKMVMLNPHLGADALAKTDGVVLVDELDLHLHPKWQRRIVEDLRRTFPRVQFICTTHSPFIVQSLRSGEELIVLDGQPVMGVANLSIREVAQGLMGVDESETSKRYGEMKDTARALLEEIEARKPLAGEALAEFEKRLAQATGPYADNPAYQAFLEMKLAFGSDE
ncbi:AAA family ATPase [Sinorhizobium meliloti]|uniref:AAA family ATPase n=1 Tax=Rhizobium meliloti TaxID=382 RepID=UPI00244DB8F8|nr:AAA family ATPase [Sinorhizobium meliloti]WGI73326.1 AAA family ATPase [Sinorhizobium meliloti]